MAKSTDKPNGPELVVGLVGAIGTDLDAVAVSVENALASVGYRSTAINLVETLAEYPRFKDLSPSRRDERYKRRMDAGNEFRALLTRADALALMAIARIQHERRTSEDAVDRPIPRHCYILQSLKTPAEVERLRTTYGDNLVVISAFSDKAQRVRRIAKKIADSMNDSELGRHEARAAALIQRDQNEPGFDYGQNVRDTFPLADLFVDATDPGSCENAIERFFKVLFEHPVTTPTRAEFGMFQAYGAALCSSAGRQVGAAIATNDGDIVSIGANEVAKPFGGQYWPEDGAEKDQRDYKRGNPNKAMLDSILADLFARLRHTSWLDKKYKNLTAEELVSKAKQEKLLDALIDSEERGRPSLLDKALLMNIIEFFRAVHGEMAALMSAARRGVSVDGCTLYATTFPCHECARHIVAAGIRRVLFIEPYPKSRVAELYDDSISVDDRNSTDRVQFEPFVGVAPRRYVSLFLMPDRGSQDEWEKKKRTALPRGTKPLYTYGDREKENVALLSRALKAVKEKL